MRYRKQVTPMPYIPVGYMPTRRSRRSLRCICARTDDIGQRDTMFSHRTKMSNSLFNSKAEKTVGKCEEPKKKEVPCPPAKPPCPPQPKPKPKPATSTSSSCSKMCPPRSRNPFIIFFLTLQRKNPNKHVTHIACEAGKQWSCMSQEQKSVYRAMAKKEQKRRRLKQQQQKRRVQKNPTKCQQR